MPITGERAERIVKAHPCEQCGEYNFKRTRVAPAAGRLKDELGVYWHARMTCGVCGHQQEVGLDDDGDIVFVG